ncbi:uncharacterized protein yc1106_09067 [Curvularia clavata]|uniref:Uncharacterized protein n=1 Tax=Curvularia clavata TaxID=95742 RepID=A0A9Q8ZJF6_CURCL|nr:uncharacterized protein yc1106_09067 [Curvularia clavata]
MIFMAPKAFLPTKSPMNGLGPAQTAMCGLLCLNTIGAVVGSANKFPYCRGTAAVAIKDAINRVKHIHGRNHVIITHSKNATLIMREPLDVKIAKIDSFMRKKHFRKGTVPVLTPRWYGTPTTAYPSSMEKPFRVKADVPKDIFHNTIIDKMLDEWDDLARVEASMPMRAKPWPSQA